jgi:4,5-DOPA dioxygenase extradiol
MTAASIQAMPVLFVGHGNPMNSISDNQYTRGWAEIGRSLPSPRAILAISAHWYLPGTWVTARPRPRTIHDFYGFPEELFQVEYPAAGSTELAEEVVELLRPQSVQLDYDWGLDHGSWSVLRHIYPQAQVPVVQLSLDLHKSPAEHFRLGQQLAALRRKGVLILGSGNIVHNLQRFNWQNPAVAPPGWAGDFENWVRENLLAGKEEELIDFTRLGRPAALAVPTPDHYLPLLYIAALRAPQDRLSFPVEGFDGGTMSMLSILFGT